MSNGPRSFEWPREDEHTAIVGRNGSGKTQLGAFMLTKQDYLKRRWVVIDYKREEIFQRLKNIREIGFNEVPKEPGLYILKSGPYFEDETEGWLWRVHQRGGVGLFADEGYMLPNSGGHAGGAYQAILTQGRSLRIPVVTLTQRPVKVTPFAFSEAKHVAVFDLSRRKDWQTIEENTVDGFSEWLPKGYENGLPEFHARWFMVNRKQFFLFKPVPDAKAIIAELDSKLPPRRKWF